MQNINDIYSMINLHYKNLQIKYDTEKMVYQNNVYTIYPRLEEIDREISSLAIDVSKKVLKENISPDDAQKMLKDRLHQLENEKNDIINKNNIKDYSPNFECLVCKDTGYIDNGKKCNCYVKKIQEHLILPGEIQKNNNPNNQTFDNFNIEYYPKETDPILKISPYELMKKVYSVSYKYASDFTKDSASNLLFCGPSGLGKTFLAKCISSHVSQKGSFVIYKSAYKLFEFLEDYKFGKIDRDKYMFVYDSIYNCDLLIIDDLGTEFITTYTQSVFFDLLTSRLDMGKSMVISTNLPMEKISEIYQQRVMSRLLNEFNVLRFAGVDIRSLKNNK